MGKCVCISNTLLPSVCSKRNGIGSRLFFRSGVSSSLHRSGDISILIHTGNSNNPKQPDPPSKLVLLCVVCWSRWPPWISSSLNYFTVYWRSCCTDTPGTLRAAAFQFSHQLQIITILYGTMWLHKKLLFTLRNDVSVLKTGSTMFTFIAPILIN